jgi:hypothetical protein
VRLHQQQPRALALFDGLVSANGRAFDLRRAHGLPVNRGVTRRGLTIARERSRTAAVAA